MNTSKGHINVEPNHVTEFPLVRVTWVDTESFDEWTAVDDLDEGVMPLITSVGYLVMEEKEFLIIAADLDAKNGTCARRLKIPQTAVRNVKTLIKAKRSV